MPISNREWVQIYGRIQSIVSKKGEPFVQGKVIRRDEINKLVWVAEFGDTPIPVIAFEYEVKVYEETPRGTLTPSEGAAGVWKTYKKKYKVTPVIPEIGQTVLVAQHLGSRRLPKCLGVLMSTNFIERLD